MKKRAIFLLLLFLWAMGACGETAEEINSLCSVWRNHNVGMVKIFFPSEGAAAVSVVWEHVAQDCVYNQYDEEDNLISTCAAVDGVYAETVAMGENAACLEIRFPPQTQSVRSFSVYGEGELPAEQQCWQAPYETCDVLLLVAHQDDEWLWFGGLIPYCEQWLGKNVTVVYMTNCGRYRCDEALAGLWEGGHTRAPVFLNLPDENISSLAQTLKHWGGENAAVSLLAECICRYRPEIIITHGLEGEYGHNQHKLTSSLAEKAIERAAAEGTEQYGTWQVKKLYRRGEGESTVTLDWESISPNAEGQTPYDIADAAYAKHVSQQKYYLLENGGLYDNRVFHLCYTAVGQDSGTNDLFEHIGEGEEE